MTVDANRSRRQRIGMIAGILALVALSVVGWFRLRVDSSLEPLLPEKSEARQTVLFLRDSSFASKAVLWFRLHGDGPVTDLYAAADEAEKHLDPKLIKQVIHPPQEADAFDEALGLLDHAGELLNDGDRAELTAAITPDALKKRMRECYLQLLRPEGSFMQPIIRKDPLGISARILSRLYGLTNGLGYRVEAKGGRLVHADGRQLLLVMETSTTATSLGSSQALVESLNRISASAPPGVEIIPMCAQIHTVQNQQLMEADTHRAGSINGVVFLLLFLLVSRDWRIGSIFLLPVASAAITIGLCALIHPTLSMLVIGLSMTMAGSAVDYGIFVYTAVATGSSRKQEMRRIWKPLVISHLTTLGVFLAFLFSTIPAYRQLGWMTSLSLALSLLAALFVLPKIIRPGGKIFLLGSGMPLTRWGKIMVPVTVISAVLLVAAVFVSRRTNFDPDISRLDGVSPSVKKAEDDFQRNWGRSDADQGIIAVSGKTRELAEEANDKINLQLAEHFKNGEIASMSSFWPSEATRSSNFSKWRQFWTPERIADLRRDLASAGEPYGFSADAFDPFFQSLTSRPGDDNSRQLLSAIEDLFVARAGNDYQMLNYFIDTAGNVDAMRRIVRGHPEAQVVSRRALGQAFADAAVSETKLLVGISSAFIVIFLLALTRNPAKSLIIMLPAFTGLVAMLAVLAMLSLSMSVVTVVAAILVLALASDYGVFAAYAWENREPLFGQGMASVHLCALTTVVGIAALIFARHPALHLVGVSLTSGLLGGYLTAFFVIPGICYLLDRRKNLSKTKMTQSAAVAGLLLLIGLLGGCGADPYHRAPLPVLKNPNPQAVVAGFAKTIPDQFTSDDTVVIHAPFRDDMAVLAVLRVDRKARTFELYGLHQTGMEVFHVGGDKNTTSIRSAIPQLMEHKEVLLSMGKDIGRMYFDLIPDKRSEITSEPLRIIFSEKTFDGALVREYGSDPPVLLEKHLDGFFGPTWRVQYFDYRPTADKLYPRVIVMDNNQYHYRIVVKNRDWAVEQ